MADVSLHNVHKSFGNVHVLRDINLEIRSGEFVVFVGPSGCGKSTLLRVIAGLESINHGELRIGGRRVNDLAPAERGIAMVFQSYALYPHMNVYRNMAFGLKFARTEKAEIDRRVRHAAEILKLTPLLERKPRELSGGQRQRVAIGRAIVRNPSVFLFDEPLSNLDAALRVNTRLEIAKLHRDLKATMIYVTHDQVEAMTLADKIVVLSAGRVEQVGAPLDLYHHPKNLFVAGFIGSPQMNFLPGRVLGTGAGGLRVEIAGATIAVPVGPGPLATGDEITLGIRPEHMDGPSAGAALTGTIEAVERLGDASFVYMRLAHGPMVVVRVPGELTVALGQTYTAPLPERHLHLFGPDGLALSRQASREAA